MDSWLRGPLRQTFEEVALSRKEILGFPVSDRFLQRMFEQHIAGEANNARALWTILSLFLWADKHFGAKRETGC
jgi:hypothetical protein